MGKFTVAVIAGGKSSRMGTDKSFVRLASRPLIEHVLSQLVTVAADELILVTNQPEAYQHLGLPMFSDIIAGKGSLGGIYSALCRSKHDHVLTVACDMPFVEPKLLLYMLGLCNSEGGPFDAIVPRVKKYPQGLLAVYAKTCLGHIRRCIQADQLQVIGVYPNLHIRYVDEAEYQRFDPQGRSFFNVNTPEDLEQALRIAAGDALDC